MTTPDNSDAGTGKPRKYQVLAEMSLDEMVHRAERLMARGFSEELALKIASRLDIIEETPDGKRWIIRDDDNHIIAVIDPV